MAKRRKSAAVAIIPLLLLAVLTGCQRTFLETWNFNTFSPAWRWGGDPQRRGWSSHLVNPPLKLVWVSSVGSALGESIELAGEFLFFGTKDGQVYILDWKNGHSVKSLKTNQKFETTCTVEKTSLIVAQRWGKPSLRSVDLVSGRTLWDLDLGPIEGEVLTVGDNLYVGNDRGEVFCVNSQTGTVQWKQQLDAAVRGSIAQFGQSVFVSSEKGSVNSLDADSGRILWKGTVQTTLSSGPVLSEEMVFIGTNEGNFYCLSNANGRMLWQFQMDGGIFYSAGADNDFVYIGTSQGSIYCLNQTDGRERWCFETESVIGTSPLIAGNWIYFGTLDKHLYAVDHENGKEAWRFDARGRVRTTPLIWNGMLFVASEDFYVYGFGEVK